MAKPDGGLEEQADELMAEATAESDSDLTEEREQGLGEQAKDAETALGEKPDVPQEGDKDAVEPILEPEEEGESEAQDEQEAPELDARLAHAAERMKWDADAIASLGDKAEEILGKVADGFDSISARHAELGREAIEKATPTEEDKGKKRPDLKTPFALKSMVDEDGEPTFTDEGAAALKSAEEHLNVLRETMLERVLPFVERAEMQQQNAEFEQMENFYASDTVQKNFKDVYGTGASVNLGEESSELKARVELWNSAKAIVGGYDQRGQRYDLDAALQDALSIAQRDRLQEQARNEVREELKGRAAQISARPRKRQSPGVPAGDAKAIQAVERRMAELGVDL